MFEDISTFHAQNPVVGSLLQELDIGKKDLASELIKKAPRAGIDLDLQKQLERYQKTTTNLTITTTMGRLYLHHLHRHFITLLRHHPHSHHRHLIHFRTRHSNR